MTDIQTRAKPVADDSSDDERWMARWLDAVTDQSMTQRRLSSIEAHGGLPLLTRAATARGVHLVQAVDNEGHELVAASRHPFKVIC